MRSLLLLFVFSCLSFASTGCKDKQRVTKNPDVKDSDVPSMQVSTLQATDWQPMTFAPTTPQASALQYSKPYLLQFNGSGSGEGSQLVLRLDANNCRTSWKLEGDIVSFGENFGCTKKCCDSKDGVELRDVLVQSSWVASIDANKNLHLVSDKLKAELICKPVARVKEEE